MTYSSLLAHLQIGVDNKPVLAAAGDLAALFGADVLGVAACQPAAIPYGDGFTSGVLIQECRDELEKETKAAEASFFAALRGRVANPTWRASIDFAWPSDFIAEQSRGADLVITAPEAAGSVFDESRVVSIPDLVMTAGRPVLIVPPSVGTIDLTQIVVAWKDTREARRAIADALPLLKKAGHVTLVELASKDELMAARDRVDDVVAWLGRHGVMAERVVETPHEDDARRLGDIARDKGAGVLVAGAYGHSRVREWAFGGVTRNLLLHPECCTLVSH